LIIGLLVSHQFRLTILIADPLIPQTQINPDGNHTKNQSRLGDQTEEGDDDAALWLERAILLGIPCEDNARDVIHKRLTLWKIVPDCGVPGPGPGLDGSGHYLFNTCSVRDAQSTSLRIQEEWKPHVFLADASWMASFWMVEQGNLPTVAVVSDPSTIFPILVQHHRSWTPSSDRSFLAQIPVLLSQRWQSLRFTWFFMEVNRQRRKEHLRQYRRPLEHLESAVVVLSEFGKLPVPMMMDDDEAYNPQRHPLTSGTSNSWKNFIVTGPILSPCVPCHNSDGTLASSTTGTTTASSSSMKALRSAWRDTAASTFLTTTTTTTTPPKSLATILIVPPSDPTPVTVRTLLQGLSLARSSLASYDDCDWDSWTCQKIAKDFQIRWLTMDVSTHNFSDSNISNDNNRAFLPPVTMPEFYQEHSVSLLDSVARHHDDTKNITTKSVLLVILPCQDRNARILPSVFEISVLCYDNYQHRHRGDALSTTTTTTTSARPGESTNNVGRMAYLVLKSDTNPREIAAPILRLLRYRRARDHVPVTKNLKTTATGATATSGSTTTGTDAVAKSHYQLGSLSSLDGLTRAVSIIHRIAELNRRKENQWTSPSEMQRVLSLAVRNLTHPCITHHLNLDGLDHDTDDDKGGDPYRSVVHHDSLLVFLAWIFLGTATLYIAIQELFASSSMWHLHRIPTTTSSISTTPTILWTRGPDLDDAWTLWLEWYHDQPDDWLSALDRFSLGKTQGRPQLTTTINTADVKIPVRATPPPPPPTASSSELHSSPNHNHPRIPGQHVRRRKKR
jgi:hypothetical protein